MFSVIGPNIYVDYNSIQNDSTRLNMTVEELFLNKEYLIERIISDYQMTSELLINVRQRSQFRFTFNLPEGEKTPLTTEISIADVKEYLSNNPDKDNGLLKEINHYESTEYANKHLMTKVAFDNYTRKDLLDFLKQNPEDFQKKLEDNTLEVPKDKLYKIFLDDAFMLDIFSNPKRIMEPIMPNFYPRYAFDSLTEEEKENVLKNVSESIFHINLGRMINQNLTFNRGHVDEFETPELLKNIIEELKDDYTDLKKARYVYGALCQDLSYDENFYMNGQFSNDTIHSDITRLNSIKKGDLVTCNEITMLFAKYLDEANIPYTIVGYAPKNSTLTEALSEQKTDYATHLRIIAKIDYHLVIIDPAHGLFQSDLANAKLSNSTVSFKSLMPYEYFDGVFNEEIKEVEKDLESRKPLKQRQATELNELIEAARKDDLTNEDRIDLLLMFLKTVDLNSFDSFNWTKDLNKYLGKRIIGKDENQKDIFEDLGIINIEYIINKEPYQELLQGEEFDLCVTVNKDGLDQVESNKYYIYYKGEEQDQLTREQLQEKFSSGVFKLTNSNRTIPGIELVEEEKNI